MKELADFLYAYFRCYWWINTKYCDWVAYNTTSDGDRLLFLVLLPLGVMYLTYWLTPALHILFFGLPIFFIALLAVHFCLVWLKNTVADFFGFT